SASCKFDLIRCCAIANAKHGLHLLKPSSEFDDSLNTFEVQSWALVTDVVVVDGVVTGVVPGFNLVLLFGAIFFNHKKTQYPLDFNTIITQEKDIVKLTRV
nr:hypothetical protein [Tanacetum cinerariifolium]